MRNNELNRQLQSLIRADKPPWKLHRLLHAGISLSTAKKLLLKAGEEDIVLSDLRLPDGEGIALSQTLAQSAFFRHVKGAFMTGSVAAGNGSNHWSEGGNNVGAG